MNMFDKLLGFDFVEDLTETTWWTETVFRGLEKGGSGKQDGNFEVEAAPTRESTELQ